MITTSQRQALLHRFIGLQPVLRARFRSTLPPEIRARLQETSGELTASQFEILTLLQANPEGLTMGELAAAHSSTAATATQLVERLVRMDMVERLRDGDDRRVVRVRLSHAAEQRCGELTRLGMEHLEGMTAVLSDDELETLVELLARVARPLALPALVA